MSSISKLPRNLCIFWKSLNHNEGVTLYPKLKSYALSLAISMTMKIVENFTCKELVLEVGFCKTYNKVTFWVFKDASTPTWLRIKESITVAFKPIDNGRLSNDFFHHRSPMRMNIDLEIFNQIDAQHGGGRMKPWIISKHYELDNHVWKDCVNRKSLVMILTKFWVC